MLYRIRIRFYSGEFNEFTWPNYTIAQATRLAAMIKMEDALSGSPCDVWIEPSPCRAKGGAA